MTALQIADIKSFMKKFLLTDSFDRFLLLEGAVTTFNTFRVDGTLQKSYYTQEEQELLAERSLSLWGEVRPFCLELIKGKRTPLSFRFTFQLSASNTAKLGSVHHAAGRGLQMYIHVHARHLCPVSVLTCERGKGRIHPSAFHHLVTGL